MSKRAVEAAWKAYPDGESPDWAADQKIIYKQIASRSVFIQGYEQAEKDYIRLAQLWADSKDVNVMSFERFLKKLEQNNG